MIADEEFEVISESEKFILNSNYEDIEIIDGQEVVDFCGLTKFYDNTDHQVVYINSSIGEIFEGVSFIVSGQILFNCERFSIDLMVNNPTKDIALHINPRLPQNYIVRNCRVNKTWGTEEITSALPFILQRGTKFIIQIFITNIEFLISINGRHFAAFRHRLPYHLITCLDVKGDVENIHFSRTITKEYPKVLDDSKPKQILVRMKNTDSTSWNSELSKNSDEKPIEIPYFGVIPTQFFTGEKLKIEGRVKILPHSFMINLQSGYNIWPHPTIPFHFNPRFANSNGKHIICKNSWADGKWNNEERSESHSDFVPGKPFILYISCTDSAFEIYLNEKFLADLKFRSRTDSQKVDTIYIQGDIIVKNISLEIDKEHF